MNSSIGIRMKTEYPEVRTGHRVTDVLQDIIVMTMLLMGVAGQLIAWTQTGGMESVRLWIIFGVATMATVILGHVSERQVFGYMAAPLILVITVLIHGVSSVYYGFFGIINYMISWWNVSHEDAVKLVMEEQIRTDDVRLCATVIVLIMIPIWWNIVRHHRVLAGLVVILVFVIPGLVIQSGSVAACGAMLAGWFGLLLARGASASGVRGIVWQLAVSAVCIGSALFAGTGKMNAVVNIKDQADRAIQHLRYGHDTLPEGDISKADMLLSGDDPVLEITTEQKKNIYLKGFVGARYEDGKWTALSDAQYRGDRDGMFSWLSDRNFLVQDQYSHYEYLDLGKDYTGNLVTVKNIGANRKYVYAPYSADVPDGTKVSINEDSNYLAFGFMGAENYEFVDRSGDRPGELLYADGWVTNPETEAQEQYVEAEKVYADFVYDSYLDVDSGVADIIDEVFSEKVSGDTEDADANAWENAETIYLVTEQIRNVLKDRTMYVESPELPGDVDPVAWFLVGGRQGNSVLYASAAVMAYRCKGIPARYVEGYRISGDMMAEKMILTNRNSHAWVEVYLDGVGWIPVDVTPGFYYDTYTLLQMVKKPQNVNESAASDDSSNMGTQLDENSEQSTAASRKKDKKTNITIPLDILVVMVMIAAFVLVLLEVRYFVRRLTLDKRYGRLTDVQKTKALCNAIIKLISLYGCDVTLGWNAEKVDEFIANELGDGSKFFEGEYLRISQIMDKYAYGGLELTTGEIRTLYVFAEKLYEAGSARKLTTRLKLRYGI